MKKTLLFPAMILIAIGLGSCAKEGGVDRGDINAAIKISAGKVTATSACITGECAQENVVGCYYLKPVETSSVSMVDMDAIDKKAYILEHGIEASIPLRDSATVQLLAETSYTVAVIGYDKNKVIRTAPYYTTFKTGKAEVSASARLDNTSTFDFIWSIEKGEFTSYVKYITSTDKAVTSLDSDGLKSLILKGGDVVKTTTSDIPEAHEISEVKTDFVVAALAFDDLDRPGDFSYEFVSTETTVKVKINGGNTTLLSKPQKDVDIYTGTVEMPATGKFTILINGQEYGFTSYSGNGGVGTVNNMKSAMPFYNLTTDMTWKFYVEKAIGQMTPIADGGNAFWTNMTATGKVDVRIDMTNTDGICRYYLKMVQSDPNVVFYEGFDMSVWGSLYQSPIKGTGYNGANYAPKEGSNAVDGTEPGQKGTISTTGTGIDFITWPVSEDLGENEVHPGDTLMNNLELQDWGLKRTFLIAGAIRLGNSKSTHYDAWVTTPKFTSLTASTDITVTAELYSFAGGGEIEITVLGAGEFTKAVITNTQGVDLTENVGGAHLTTDKICVIDGTICPKEANATVNKTTCKVILSVAGATSDTQIKIYVPERTTGANGRTCIDYIKVTK